MKKKFLNGLLIVAMFFAATSSLMSCKDYNTDEMAEVKSSIVNLYDLLNADVSSLQAQLNALKAAQEECRQHCAAVQADLQNQINNLKSATESQINSLKAEIEALKNEIAALKAQDVLLQKAIDQINVTLNDYNVRITKNENDIANLTTLYNTLNTTLINVQALAQSAYDLAKQADQKADEAKAAADAAQTTADAAKAIAEAAKAQAEANLASIEELKNKITEINNKLTTIQNDITQLQTDVAAAQARADAAYAFAEANKVLIDELTAKFDNYYTKAEVDSMHAAMETEIANAQQTADDAKTLAEEAKALAETVYATAAEALAKANANSMKIYELEKALNDEIDNLQDQIDALKTKIEQLKDKIYGDLAKMITGIIFQGAYNPVVGSLFTPFGLSSNILCAFYGENTGATIQFPNDVLDADALPLIAAMAPIQIQNGDKLVDDGNGGTTKAYAGTFYATINPNTVDFSGQQLQLVNSRDEEAKFELDDMEASTDLISFGYTRAGNDNGFYKANAYVKVDNIDDVKLSNGIDVESLKGVAKEILNKLKDRSNSVNISNIYKTLMNNMQDISPAYGLKASWTDSESITHSIYSQYNIAATAVKPLSFDFLKDASMPTIRTISAFSYDVDFNLDYIEIDKLAYPDAIVHVWVVKDGAGRVIYVTNDMYDAMAKVSTLMGAVGFDSVDLTINGLQQLVYEINEGMIPQMKSGVDYLIDQIKQQTQDNVNAAINKVNTKVVDRVNRIINKINSIISNPNHYLQPTMIYEGADNKWYIMSNNPGVPSVVKGTGGMLVEPTSLTAELLAPAFKKYVAVTNVWKNSDPAVSAKGGDATCKDLVNKANDTQYRMNTIFNDKGDVIFYADKADYTYEISYATVDYSGKTRLAKFYVKVIE